MGDLGGPYEYGQGCVGSQEGYRLGEDGFEVLYGSEGYYFGAGAIWPDGQDLGAAGDYIDIGQCKCAGRFAEEGSLLVARFDHR